MYALAVQKIPEGSEWLYEVKFDGYRCVAGRRNNGVILRSRRRNDFTSQFTLIARACQRLSTDTLLDDARLISSAASNMRPLGRLISVSYGAMVTWVAPIMSALVLRLREAD